MKKAKGLSVQLNKGHITGVLYQTRIVDLDLNKKVVKLNSGGWETAHTKKCINRILSFYEIDAQVFQKNYQWYVQIGDKSLVFQDEMTFQFQYSYEKVS